MKEKLRNICVFAIAMTCNIYSVAAQYIYRQGCKDSMLP